MDVSCVPWTRLSHIPARRITCHRLVYSYVPVPVSRVSLTVRMWTVDSSMATCLFPVSPFVSLTRLCLRFTYAFYLVDSSPYVSRLCLSLL